MSYNETSAPEAERIEWEYYRYHPSLVAAIIFVVLFFITTGIHLFQLLRWRTWYFIPLVIGGFCKFPIPHYHFSFLSLLLYCKKAAVSILRANIILRIRI